MTKKTYLNIFLWIIAVALISGIAYGSFFIYKVYWVGKKITISPKNNQGFLETLKSFSSSDINLRGMDKNRINILMMGVAGKGKPGQNLTDTIMIASINPKTNQVALLSIPRDLYVSIPDTNTYTKINSVYQIELNSQKNGQEAADAMKNVIKNITGLDINYYIILNFDGFTRIIDTVGGVNITSDRDIHDERYPGPNYSYETFDLKKGFHQLDGATALKYARERHDDPQGDFGRAKRQQQILEATKSKVFSADTILNVFKVNDIFNALGDNIKTDIAPSDFQSFWELAKNANTNNINNVVADAWNKNSLLKVSHVSTNSGMAFILVPRIGNWNEIQDLAQNMFDLNILNRRKEEIASENATVAIINKSGNATLTGKIKKLLNDNFDYKNVIILNDTSKNLEENSHVFDLSDGTKPFTLDELIKKLPATSTQNLNDSYRKIIQNTTPDLVIILGKDIVDKYNMAEDSFDAYNKASDTNEYTEFLNK
jgi:LCP family protein required for cell wall assembly